jgi:hypothetical protein
MKTPTMKFEGAVMRPPYDWRVVVIICYTDQPKRMVGGFFYFGDAHKMVEQMNAESSFLIDWGEGDKECILKEAKIVNDTETVYVEFEIKNET